MGKGEALWNIDVYEAISGELWMEIVIQNNNIPIALPRFLKRLGSNICFL